MLGDGASTNRTDLNFDYGVSDMSFPPLVLIPLYRQFVRKTSPAELLLVIFFYGIRQEGDFSVVRSGFISSVGDERC